MDQEITVSEMAAKALNDFTLAKYLDVSKLTILDWRSIIGYRDGILSNIDWMMDAEKSQRLKAYIRRISDAPLSLLRATHRTYDPAVTDMTALDAWVFQRSIELHAPDVAKRMEELDALQESNRSIDLDDASDAEVEEILKRVDEERTIKEELSLPYRKAMGDEADISYLAVDCSAPDDVLLSHFREWLNSYRSESGRQAKSISEADMRKWAQHRVLPYIDLRILSKLAGIELTNFAIGCRIFPDLQDVDVAEKIRKTTSPLADWMLGRDGLDSIIAVANAEQRKLVGKNWG